MVFALLNEEPPVSGRKGRIDLAREVGCEEQVESEPGVAFLRDAVFHVRDPGLVNGGNEAGEGSDAGEAVEPVQVTEAAQNTGSERRADSWNRDDDPIGIRLFVEVSASVVERRDLGVELFDLADLDRDVFSELFEIETTTGPQQERLIGGGQ